MVSGVQECRQIQDAEELNCITPLFLSLYSIITIRVIRLHPHLRPSMDAKRVARSIASPLRLLRQDMLLGRRRRRGSPVARRRDRSFVQRLAIRAVLVMQTVLPAILRLLQMSLHARAAGQAMRRAEPIRLVALAVAGRADPGREGGEERPVRGDASDDDLLVRSLYMDRDGGCLPQGRSRCSTTAQWPGCRCRSSGWRW